MSEHSDVTKNISPPPPPVKRKGPSNKWEWIIFTFGLIIFSTSATAYFSGFSLRKYIFGQQVDDENIEKVGVVKVLSGSVRRQKTFESDFSILQKGQDLFNFDTIVTGEESGAVLLLADGTTINLSPNTMIRLSFEKRLSLQGFSKASSVNIVSGSVAAVSDKGRKSDIVLRSRDKEIKLSDIKTAEIAVAPAPIVKAIPKPKPLPVVIPPVNAVALPALNEPALPTISPTPSPIPTPSPEPIPSPLVNIKEVNLKLISPELGKEFNVPKGSLLPSIKVKFEWRGDEQDLKFIQTAELVVKKQKENTKPIRKTIKVIKGKLVIEIPFDQPGTYQWNLNLKGQDLKLSAKAQIQGNFLIDPQFEGVEILAPLVAGKETQSNEYQGEILTNFNIKLRWKKFPNTKIYRIDIADSKNPEKILLSKTTTSPEYVLNKDKLFVGNVNYKVYAVTSKNFVAYSPLGVFNFDFLPPKLVLPLDKTVITPTVLKAMGNTVLITWQKTNFTDGYELEIAKDPEFKNFVFKERLPENFKVLRPLPIGKYWWRSRSFSKEISSPFSNVRSFEMSQK